MMSCYHMNQYRSYKEQERLKKGGNRSVIQVSDATVIIPLSSYRTNKKVTRSMRGHHTEPVQKL